MAVKINIIDQYMKHVTMRFIIKKIINIINLFDSDKLEDIYNPVYPSANLSYESYIDQSNDVTSQLSLLDPRLAFPQAVLSLSIPNFLLFSCLTSITFRISTLTILQLKSLK